MATYVEDAILAVGYEPITYTGGLNSAETRDAERGLTRALLKTYRADQRERWQGMHVDIETIESVAAFADKVLAGLRIRVNAHSMDIMNSADWKTPQVKRDGTNTAVHTIRYIYVSILEHRVVYTFDTEFPDSSSATGKSDWQHTFALGMGKSATGRVRVSVSWAEVADFDPLDLEEQIERKTRREKGSALAGTPHHPQ